MQELQNALDTQSAVNLEFFYWMSIALMFVIHAGFLVYETGAS
jgi:ammonium transporter, Amt family